MADEKEQELVDGGAGKEKNTPVDNEQGEVPGEEDDIVDQASRDETNEASNEVATNTKGTGESTVDDSPGAVETNQVIVESESELEGELDFEPDEDEVLDALPVAGKVQKERGEEEEKKNLQKNQVEAVLFVSGQAVSAEEISVKLGFSKKIIEELLEKLAMEYLDRSTSLEIAKVADKYILQLKPEFTSSVKSFAAGGLIREAVMRTLTIIAAKQPIVQSELSKLRSSAGEHIKELLDLGLVRATPKGRSRELVTTDKFADMFGFSRDVKTMKDQIKIYLTAATQGDDE